MRLPLLLMLTLCGALTGMAAEAPWGLPPLRTYPFEEIGNVTAGVRLSPDPLGRLTVVQSGAHIVFDNWRWSDLAGPEDDRRDLGRTERAPDGTIFCAAAGSWGYLESTSTGLVRVHSLVPATVPGWARNTEFNQIIFAPEGVVFAGGGGLVFFERETQQNHFFELKDLVNCSFFLDDSLYVSTGRASLLRLDLHTGTFTPIPIAPLTKDDVIAAAAYDAHHSLLLTYDGHAYLFDGTGLTPWTCEIDGILREGVTAAHQIDDEFIAIAVLGRGVYLLDRHGRIHRSLEEPQFAKVSDLRSFEPGLLWIATEIGITKILYRSPVEIFDHRLGLNLHWPTVLSHQGRTFIISDGKLYQSTPANPGKPTSFVRIELPMREGLARGLSTPHGLLLASPAGVFVRDDHGDVQPVLHDMNVARLVLANAQKDLYLAIGPEEICLLEWTGQTWRQSGERIPGLGYPSEVVSAVPGSAWIELGLQQVGRVWFRDGKLQARLFADFPWPKKYWIGLGAVGHTVVLSHAVGERHFFDESTDSFCQAPDLAQLLDQSPVISLRPLADADGTIWLPGRNIVGSVRREPAGPPHYEFNALRTLRDVYPMLSLTENGDLWVRSEHQLQRIDRHPTTTPLRPPAPILTRIYDTRTHLDLTSASAPADVVLQAIPYRSNSLSFQFFPGTFWQMSSPSYQFKLEGYAEEWSAPSPETTIAFANLREGDYRLTVRLVDATGQISDTTSLAFTIRPPLYRTWYAVSAYLLLFGTGLWGTLHWRLRRIRRRNTELARLVDERTSALDQANRELRRAVADATHATEAKSRFLANMSHEIRTPMNGVLGLIEALSLTKLDAAQRELCRVVQTNAESLLTVIGDILDFSKIEQGQLTIERAPFHLGHLVRDTIALFKLLADSKRLSLVQEAPAEIEASYVGDPVRLRQVLSNLLGNAIKFTTRGRVLLRITSPAPDRFRFEVNDTGIGVTAEAQARLFRPFAQADDSQTRHHGGTGLGLAISKHLIESMGGQIGLASAEGQGSTFWFELTLPPHHGSLTESGHATAAPVSAGPATAPLHLLVVEDHPTGQLVARLQLERLGHRVAEADSGGQALARLREGGFDAILMDCQMPGMDGLEATRRIRTGEVPGLDPGITIIAVTAHATTGDEDRCLAAGMNGYLTKPLKIRALIRMLADLGLAAGPTPGENNPASQGAETEANAVDADQLGLLASLAAPGGGSLLEASLAAFREEMPRRLAELEKHIRQRNHPELAKTAHTLSGSAANIGATALRMAAKKLQRQAAETDWPGAESSLHEVRQTWTEFQRILSSSPSPSRDLKK